MADIAQADRGTDHVPGRATGIGSWPGTDVVEAVRLTFGELAAPHLPHLPELPARGPGADLVGRAAALLVDLAVDLQPSGWRLVDRPGRDLSRARAWLRQDLDALAEVADGYEGPLKLQVAGPWTLAASLLLPRLERAVVDPGARRDLVASLAEGVAVHVAAVRRLVPGATLTLQLDEPSVAAVLGGTLPTASGLGRLRAVEEPLVAQGVREVLDAARAAGATATCVHCCAADAPLPLLVGTGCDALSVDVTLLGASAWEELAPFLEGGRSLWAGAVRTTGTGPRGTAASVADTVLVPWKRLGLDTGRLAQVLVTPTCGLATVPAAAARPALRLARDAAAALAEYAQG